jgi:hypothetical protein
MSDFALKKKVPREFMENEPVFIEIISSIKSCQ